MKKRVTFQLRDALDRRNGEQQYHADMLLEASWRARVAANPKERARLTREAAEQIPGLLRKQALDFKVERPLEQGEPQAA